MTGAIDTTAVVSEHLPGVSKVSADLRREGAPIEPDPPVSHWKPEAVRYYEAGARIEAAFRNHTHRADAKQQEDSYVICSCHANVIRYLVCRALPFPPEVWLRLSLKDSSISHLVVRPGGRGALRALGDTGFMPPAGQDLPLLRAAWRTCSLGPQPGSPGCRHGRGSFPVFPPQAALR
ncbi:serine threonine-protein phosphatase [Lynx pardinus]|uniref:Serine/threonine-protein phosphatase PGAM5, mitochondrial n=1 Tax=Lynx pardinus TaxID=191816 RepID=A0A485PLM2_LYNPA|nr:serine threonine-protein phosphatase [Lynx pardinus]